MNDDATPYLLKSWFILKNQFSPLLVLLVVSIIIPNVQNEADFGAFLLGALIMILLYPAVYGQYTEIVLRNRKADYLMLFRRHFLNFFLVNIVLWLPIILLVFLGMVLHSNAATLIVIGSIAISALSIYVLPLVFITGKILESIRVGFKCVLGNVQFNLPLIFIVAAATILPYLISYTQAAGQNTNGLVAVGLVMAISLTAEFLVFVAAILILKDKGIVQE